MRTLCLAALFLASPALAADPAPPLVTVQAAAVATGIDVSGCTFYRGHVEICDPQAIAVLLTDATNVSPYTNAFNSAGGGD